MDSLLVNLKLLEDWICNHRFMEADGWINQLNEFDRGKFIDWIDDDNIDALYNIGCCYYLHGDTARAIQWWNLVAENDYDHRAKFMLGCCYWNAEGIGRDLTKARYWFREAMEYGSSHGAYYLGLCYEHGIGVEQDCDTAMTCYLRGLENENLCNYDDGDIDIDIAIQAIHMMIKASTSSETTMHKAKEYLEEYLEVEDI